MENTNVKTESEKIRMLKQVPVCKDCNQPIYRRYFKINGDTYCYACLVEKHSYKVEK